MISIAKYEDNKRSHDMERCRVWVRVSQAEVIQEVTDVNVTWGVNVSEMAEETCVLSDVRVT